MPPADTDRNLLLGIFAYQNGFISRDALLAGLQAWIHDKANPLAQILQNQSVLDAERRAFLEALVEEHIKRHGDDPQKSLQAISSVSSVRESLHNLADADIQATLAYLTTPRDENVSFQIDSPAVGAATSAGTRFRRLRPHAKGGLGEVFVAMDSELNREVALKEIQDKHADNPQSRARFLQEAEITGGLEHPGIVPVYGLGAYTDGRPFYAMRFIKGDSLMDAVESFHATPHAPKPQNESSTPGGSARSPLALHKLLRRLIDVCNAIQYAHDRGVLHRDLKPGNIMLGKYGETLVVDWGLAKAQGEPGASATGDSATGVAEKPLVPSSGSGVAETVAGAAIGTPAFMSPEQAAGRLDQLGPASDVYSLGATLYCLLTGKSAFKGEVAQVLAKVQRGDFPPPRQLDATISPALEGVCLKAMSLNPQDRYASPRELAEDVEHWLADEPVKAWPEPWTVKARRWVGRHRTAVTGAAAAVLVATISLAVAAGLLSAKNEALKQANDDLAEAKTNLEDTNRNLENTNTKLDLARKDADEKRQHAEYERQIAQAVRNFLQKDLLLQADPTEQANRLLSTGTGTFSTVENPTIKELLDRAADQLTLERIDKKFPDQPLVQAEILQTVGRAYAGIGNFTGAISHLKRSMDICEAKLGREHPHAQSTMDILAVTYCDAGQHRLALPLLEETVRVSKAKLGPHDLSTEISMNNLAEAYREAGKLNLAVPLYEECVKLSKARLGTDHLQTLPSMGNLAVAYLSAGNLEKAMPLLDETLRLCKAKLGPEHPYTLTAMNNLARGYVDAGEFKRAILLYESTLKLSKAKYGQDHPRTLASMNGLATTYNVAGKLNLALPLLEEAFKLNKLKLGPEHPQTLTSMDNLGLGYLDAGKHDLAIPLLEESLKFRSATLGSEHPETLASMNNVGRGYVRIGKLDLAMPLLKEAIERMKATLGPEHPATLVSMNNLAGGYRAAGKLDLALPLLEEAFKIKNGLFGPGHPDTLMSMNNLAYVYEATGKPNSAVPLYENTLKHSRAILGPDHPRTLGTLGNLAICYLTAQLPEKALPLFDEYVEAHRRKRGGANPSFAGDLANVGLKLMNGRQFAEAEKRLRECLAIRKDKEPDQWTTFNTESMLGGALLGQKKFADAEPLLLSGYAEMLQRAAKIPAQTKEMRLQEATGRLVELFEATRDKGETKLESKLTDANPQASHEVKLTADKAVVIELRSKEFNTYLKLVDEKGKSLAENNDIDAAKKNLNSRIWFMPKANGTYRIIATSTMQKGRGAYEIIVCEYSKK